MESVSNVKWRKARASGSNGGGCVEVAASTDGQRVYTRDTTARERGHLTVTAAEWRSFVAGVRAGAFDDE